MGAIIAFPADRIVRPLKKRVARPRAKAVIRTSEDRTQERITELVTNIALKKGLSLEQIWRNVNANGGGDKYMRADLLKRLGPCVLPFPPRNPTTELEAQKDRVAELLADRARASSKDISNAEARKVLELCMANTPLRALTDDEEDLARWAFEYNMDKGRPDTMEQARARVLKASIELEAHFRLVAKRKTEQEARLDRMAELIAQRDTRNGIATTKEKARARLDKTVREIREHKT